MMKPLVKGEAPFKGANGPMIMANATAACVALGRLIAAGEQATARLAIRRCWKMLANTDHEDDADKMNGLATLEVVIDEFFNRDGNMEESGRMMLADMKKMCPDSLWEALSHKVHRMADEYLATMREWAEEKKTELAKAELVKAVEDKPS